MPFLPSRFGATGCALSSARSISQSWFPSCSPDTLGGSSALFRRAGSLLRLPLASVYVLGLLAPGFSSNADPQSG